jgi:hypothetical protein
MSGAYVVGALERRSVRWDWLRTPWPVWLSGRQPSDCSSVTLRGATAAAGRARKALEEAERSRAAMLAEWASAPS